MNSLDVLKKRVLFHKNNSVYNSLGVIKYINYSNPNNNYKKFSLLSVKSNSVIQEIISQCSNEGRSINYLVDFLVNLGYEKDEAIDFIHNLIQEGFIISEFQIKLTSKEEQLNYIIEFLKSKFLDRDLPEIISKLSEIREIILRIENTNNQGHINYIELYEDVRKCLIELTFIDVPKNFIQIDTYIPENILDWDQLKSIQNVIFFLTTVGHNVSGNLYNFKNKFFEKYGNRTISLSTVMDPDIGLESKYQPLRPSLSNMLNRKVNTTLTLSDKDTFWLKKIVNALLIVRNGKIIFEEQYSNNYDSLFNTTNTEPGKYNYYDPNWHPYYKETKLHTMQSVSKSFTAAAIGIAIKRGHIPSVNEKVMAYLDEYESATPDIRRDVMTIKDVLTMTTGILWDELSMPYTDTSSTCVKMEATNVWVKFVINQPIAFDPGNQWEYSSGATMLLAHIIKKASGQDLALYLEKHLFDKIGIQNYFWKHIPTGLTDAEGGLYLMPRDLAQFGYLDQTL
jgi:hypothetical protein